jgi:hypothetical protein
LRKQKGNKEDEMQGEVLSKDQYKLLTDSLIKSIERRKVVPLNTLKHPHYTLKKPLYITIEIEDDLVIASLDDMEAFAYADTEYEAINRLCDEIVGIYEDLKDDKENMGVLPKKWLAFLEEVIELR